jgi:hypothetical protein
MVMDLMRSCYSVNMQFDTEGTIIRQVKWYFAAPDAKVFPVPHSFGSSIWLQRGSENLGLGEVWNSKRPYYRGARPFPAKGMGSTCGQQDWFVSGVPAGTPDIRLSDVSVPTCCPQPPCQPFSDHPNPMVTVFETAPVAQAWNIISATANQLFLQRPSTPTVLWIAQRSQIRECSGNFLIAFAKLSGRVPGSFSVNSFCDSFDPATGFGVWSAPEAPKPLNQLQLHLRLVQ